MRKLSLEPLQITTQPTAVIFDQQSSRLLLGDESGFLTLYDLSGFIQQVAAKPVQLRKKTISDSRLDNAEQ